MAKRQGRRESFSPQQRRLNRQADYEMHLEPPDHLRDSSLLSRLDSKPTIKPRSTEGTLAFQPPSKGPEGK